VNNSYPATENDVFVSRLPINFKKGFLRDSIYVVWDEKTEKIIVSGKETNDEVAVKIRDLKKTCDLCCIEMISAYGQVGASVLDTCVWIGIFAEIFGRSKVEFIFRKTVVTYHSGSPKANDSAIRTILITRYGNGNTRTKQKGTILENITADMWQALAIAVYKSDLIMKRIWHGQSDFVKKGK
jgi:hypothetical protein